jgi:hypothetical protein
MLIRLKQRLEHVRDLAEYAAAKAFIGNKVSTEIQEYRYAICQECPFLYKPTDNCKKCGCLMKIKTFMPRQSCPIGKWAEVED